MKTKLTLDEALEHVGFGPFQVRLLLLCGAIWAAVAMDVLVVSFALPSLRQEWALSPTQAGLLASAAFWGMLVGAWFWGIVADRVGRRRVLAITIIVENVFTLFASLAPSFPVVLVMRALIGFGMGGALPADYALFAEFLPVDRRGRNLVLMEGFWAVGALAAAGAAWAVIPKFGWRPFFALAALPGILAYYVLRHVPESPRFLVVRGQAEQAWEVLARIAHSNGRSFPN
ncbi:MAG: MFS transporter, partial [Candidatus Bipolaricaulaceae bacterium]